MPPIDPPIDPKIDCVFKAILGAQENINLLTHFLNAVLRPADPIVEVKILNPYSGMEHLNDKMTIVDIKATDRSKNIYQIEVQLCVRGHLPKRMLYSWSDLYKTQIQSGEDYGALQPVISIWLLGENLFKDEDHGQEGEHYHYHFQVFAPEQGRTLSRHFSIHVLELQKWRRRQQLAESDHWMYFFKEAAHWSVLPDELDTREMRQAMSILQRFSEKQQDYHLYQARQNILREERTIQREELARQREELARQHEDQLRQLKLQKVESKLSEVQSDLSETQSELLEAQSELSETQAELSGALQEAVRLQALLKKSGIDPSVV